MFVSSIMNEWWCVGRRNHPLPGHLPQFPTRFSIELRGLRIAERPELRNREFSDPCSEFLQSVFIFIPFIPFTLSRFPGPSAPLDSSHSSQSSLPPSVLSRSVALALSGRVVQFLRRLWNENSVFWQIDISILYFVKVCRIEIIYKWIVLYYEFCDNARVSPDRWPKLFKVIFLFSHYNCRV